MFSTIDHHQTLQSITEDYYQYLGSILQACPFSQDLFDELSRQLQEYQYLSNQLSTAIETTDSSAILESLYRLLSCGNNLFQKIQHNQATQDINAIGEVYGKMKSQITYEIFSKGPQIEVHDKDIKEEQLKRKKILQEGKNLSLTQIQKFIILEKLGSSFQLQKKMLSHKKLRQQMAFKKNKKSIRIIITYAQSSISFSEQIMKNLFQCLEKLLSQPSENKIQQSERRYLHFCLDMLTQAITISIQEVFKTKNYNLFRRYQYGIYAETILLLKYMRDKALSMLQKGKLPIQSEMLIKQKIYQYQNNLRNVIHEVGLIQEKDDCQIRQSYGCLGIGGRILFFVTKRRQAKNEEMSITICRQMLSNLFLLEPQLKHIEY